MIQALRWACFGLGLALVGAVSLAAQEVVLGRALAQEVRELFRQTCLDCHGEDLAKPKGDFGYVLDLARIAANPDFVVPGKPDESELYLLIRDDEMPGEDSDFGVLSDHHKELVRRWIELGAPSPDGATALEVAPEEPRGRASRLSAAARTFRWAGQFHAASIHFPIALFMVAALAQLCGMAPACLLCLRISALTAPLAAALGWANAEFASYTAKTETLLEWHRWLGVTAAFAAVLAWLLVRRGGFVYKVALYGGVLLVLIAGALGGGLVHGFEHYRW